MAFVLFLKHELCPEKLTGMAFVLFLKHELCSEKLKGMAFVLFPKPQQRLGDFKVRIDSKVK